MASTTAHGSRKASTTLNEEEIDSNDEEREDLVDIDMEADEEYKEGSQ